jgi:ubiquinone/menaquinone biosynthesis C-methylase UbiE
MGAETEQAGRKRRYQRTLFDPVAARYQAVRPGYARAIVDFTLATAGIGAGDRVLDVGCGTGQLTGSLTGRGFRLTAIDLGPSMISAARQRLPEPGVSFQISSFEDFTAAKGSFDLIVSGSAFHWVDPEVKYRKSAQLLRPGGWLAILDTGERYDDPFGSALTALWRARADGGAWEQPRADGIRDSGLFAEPVWREDSRREIRPAGQVIDLENTRATTLSWPEDVRRRFTADLRRLLGDRAEIVLTQHTIVNMAQVRT